MNSNMHNSSRQSAPLFRLPLELRQEIYSYLISSNPVSHPISGVGITSVSHKLPSSALLFINKQFTADILEYYYTVTTWKLIFSHAFNFFKVDPNLDGLAKSPALKGIQKVEVVFFCDILLLKDYPSFGMARFCDEIRRRADRACEVLSQARQLRSVTVAWIDTTMTGDWTEKATTLQPLRRLASNRDVKFTVGEVNGPDDVTTAVFTTALQDVLGEYNRVDTGSPSDNARYAGSVQGAMGMRMLAFDPRQERELLQQGPRSPRILSLSARCGDSNRRDLNGDQGLETLA